MIDNDKFVVILALLVCGIPLGFLFCSGIYFYLKSKFGNNNEPHSEGSSSPDKDDSSHGVSSGDNYGFGPGPFGH